jgi:hypothetical protein
MADIDVDRIYEALQAADRAGDAEAASVLASQLRTWQAGMPREQRIAEIKAKNPGEYSPSSAEFKQKYGPASSSGFQNFRAGAGKGFYDVGRGISQIVGGMSREDVDAIRKRDAPLMDTKAGIAGNITGSIAATAPTMFIPGVNTYAGAAAVGGGLGAMQPVGTGDSRLTNTLIGGAAGMGGKYLGGKISDFASGTKPFFGSAERMAALNAAAKAESIGGNAAGRAAVSGSANVAAKGGGYTFGTVGDDVSAGLSQSQRAIMERGQKLGFKLTPGQATGSKALQQLEAKLESQPMTSGPFNSIKANNARVMAREAAAAIGEASDTLDSGTFDKAFTRISSVFDDAADDVPRAIDPQDFLSKFAGVQDELRGISTGFDDHPLIADLIKHAKAGTATGKQLQSLTSKMGKAAYKQMTTPTGDRDLGLGLYQMKDYVDDLLQSGMEASRSKVFTEARKQYRNLMMLTSRVGVVNPSTGDVSGRTLANVLQQKDKLGFLRGQNESGMYDAARFAQAFAPIVGDSGTATRSTITNPLEMLASVPFNIATRAYASAPSVALSAGVSRAAQPTAQFSQEVLRAMLKKPGKYAPFLLPGASAELASQ